MNLDKFNENKYIKQRKNKAEWQLNSKHINMTKAWKIYQELIESNVVSKTSFRIFSEFFRRSRIQGKKIKL